MKVAFLKNFKKKKNWLKFNCGLYFLDCFDVLILKIIKIYIYINMYFSTKIYLKNNRYYIIKHDRNSLETSCWHDCKLTSFLQLNVVEQSFRSSFIRLESLGSRSARCLVKLNLGTPK